MAVPNLTSLSNQGQAQGAAQGGFPTTPPQLPGGGQDSAMDRAARARMGNMRNRGEIDRATTPFDFGRFFGGMPPAAQQRFGQNFDVLDKMPMHDQLNWWANLFGPQSWTQMVNAIGEGRGLQSPGGDFTAGTPRSGQTG